jgi:hypothetical protein
MKRIVIFFVLAALLSVPLTLGQQADAVWGVVRFITYYSDDTKTEEVGAATVGPYPTGYRLTYGAKTIYANAEEFDYQGNTLKVIRAQDYVCHVSYFTWLNGEIIDSGEYYTNDINCVSH